MPQGVWLPVQQLLHGLLRAEPHVLRLQQQLLQEYLP
jgi:hypothetical protein